jgi:beta-glucosidase
MEGRRRFIPSSSKLPGIYREGWIDFNKNGVLDPYEDPSRPVDERVEDLLSRMTLEEKLEVLRVFKRVGRPLRTVEEVNEAQRRAVEESRLGIPLLLVTESACTGAWLSKPTQFPQAIALAATWDPGPRLQGR